MPFARMELVRTVASPVATVRASLARTLRDLRFSITAERVTGFEGQRGSQLAAGALQLKKSPVGIKVDLSGDGSSTVVAVHMFDRMKVIGGKAYGANRTYSAIFTEIAQTIDRSLIELDPTVVLTEPAFNSTAANIGFLERTNSASGVAGERAGNKVDQWLGAPPPPPASGAQMQVVIAVPDAEAILDEMRVQGMLTVALLVSRKPGPMPPALIADVERVATAIERVLEAAAPGSVPIVELDAGDKPVVTFLNDQARIRTSLPLRTLQRCTTCKHEKVTNPDYKVLVERNRKIRGIGGLLGASISSAGVSPFLLVGRILPLVKMDPDYVCPRCQGLEADESLVVFCPNCGDRRDEAALRKCGHCEHDFRAALTPEVLWHPVGTAAERFAPPAPLPPAPVIEAPVQLPPQPAFAPGYYADPAGRFEARWWDGFQWTSQVIIAGQPGVDPGDQVSPTAPAQTAQA
jgi:hypothetical protein